MMNELAWCSGRDLDPRSTALGNFSLQRCSKGRYAFGLSADRATPPERARAMRVSAQILNLPIASDRIPMLAHINRGSVVCPMLRDPISVSYAS